MKSRENTQYRTKRYYEKIKILQMNIVRRFSCSYAREWRKIFDLKLNVYCELCASL